MNKQACWLHREVVEKVQSLKEQLSGTQTELASLQQQYSLSEKRLVRASKLISALGDEAGRWGVSADTLATRLQLLIGLPLQHGTPPCPWLHIHVLHMQVIACFVKAAWRGEC